MHRVEIRPANRLLRSFSVIFNAVNMFFIVLLVFFGLLFLVAELVLLPGVSIGAILALVSYGGAIYIAFRDYGPLAGGIVVAVVLVLSSKTWRRFSLKQKVDSSVMPEPVQQSVRVGDTGMTVSRLAPMGKVEIGGKIYEAKSMDSYIDPRREVEVVGFENFNIIVRKHIK